MTTARERFGVAPTATPDEVSRRWRRLARQHHPDRGGDAGEFVKWRALYEHALAEAETAAQTSADCPECLGTGRISRQRGLYTVGLWCPRCHK